MNALMNIVNEKFNLISVWMNERMNGWMSKCIVVWIHEWIHGWMNKWTNYWIDQDLIA